MKTFKVLLICMFLFPLTNHAQKRKTKSAQPELQLIDSLFHGMKWRNIGPFRGGRSVASTGVIGQPHTYYMGSTGGGVYKTTDDGITWKNISDNFFKTGSVGAITVSESDTNIVVVGILILVLLDLVIVDKRYVNNDDFISKSRLEKPFEFQEFDVNNKHE